MHTFSLKTAKAADSSSRRDILLHAGTLSSKNMAGLVVFVPIYSLLLLAFMKSSPNKYSCSFGTLSERCTVNVLKLWTIFGLNFAFYAIVS